VVLVVGGTVVVGAVVVGAVVSLDSLIRVPAA